MLETRARLAEWQAARTGNLVPRLDVVANLARAVVVMDVPRHLRMKRCNLGHMPHSCLELMRAHYLKCHLSLQAEGRFYRDWPFAKHRFLTSALREIVLEDGPVEAVDAVADRRADPQRILEARETLDRVREVLPRLSPFEAKCLIGFTVGATYRELNDRPEYNKAAVGRVDNAYSRALRKMTA